MNKQSDAGAVSDRRRRMWNIALGAALAITVCFAVWQVYIFSVSPTAGLAGSRATPPLVRLPAGGLRNRAPRAASAPVGESSSADFVTAMINTGPLKPLDGDPNDLTPPEAAKRRWSFGREFSGGIEESASYQWRGKPGDAKVYYVRMLSARAFRQIGRVGGEGGLITLVFQRGRIHVTVGLRKDRRDCTITNISVKVTRWRPATPSGESTRARD